MCVVSCMLGDGRGRASVRQHVCTILRCAGYRAGWDIAAAGMPYGRARQCGISGGTDYSAVRNATVLTFSSCVCSVSWSCSI